MTIEQALCFGDCLLLDSSRPKPLSRWRQGSSALIGVVSVIVLASVFCVDAIAAPAGVSCDPRGWVGMTKINKSPGLESVSVNNSAPDKPVFIRIGSNKWGDGFCASLKFSPNTDDSGADTICILQLGGRKILFALRWAIDDPPNICSDHLAYILKNHMTQHILGSHGVHPEWDDAEIRPQLLSSGFVSAFNESVGGVPQFPSSKPQYNGENSNNSLGIQPLNRPAKTKQAPFLPVFGLGALTFLVCMFGGVNIYSWANRRSGWRQKVAKTTAIVIAALGSISFAFGFPWAALL